MAIDFDSIQVDTTALPFREAPYLRATFTEPELAGYEVIVIEDSIAGKQGTSGRLTTIAARFPRCVLAEWNTHRTFSRNSASSRARSIKSTIADVMENPYIPLFTKNRKGMSGQFVTDTERERAIDFWLEARDRAVASELSLLLGRDIKVMDLWGDAGTGSQPWVELVDEYDRAYQSGDESLLSIHKQNANRLIEPFSWHQTITTASYWQNFLELRDEDGAMPEIRAMARLIKAAFAASQPRVARFHVPFIDHESLPEGRPRFAAVRDFLMLSAAECARVSYRDKDRTTVGDSTLAEKLLAQKHLSPFEHIGIELETYLDLAPEAGLPTDLKKLSSNLDPSWVQFRQVLVTSDLTRR